MAKREPRWVAVFLKQLERTGNVRLAAERAGVDFSTAYQRRKRHSDFAEAWEGALGKFAEAPARPAFTPPVPAALLSEEERGLIIRPSQDGSGALVSAPRALTSPRWGKRAEEAFLMELTISANVRIAAREAGFSPAAVYKRRLKDPRFAEAWDAAIESGRARVQAYLVEAASRTFDPDELPVGDERDMPKVSIGEAINIAKLPSRTASATAGAIPGLGRGWGVPGRIYDDTGFDCTPISREEWEEAGQNIVNRLTRLREMTEEKERQTGCCHACGQPLPERPVENIEEMSKKLEQELLG